MRGGLGDRAETAPGPASGLIQRSLLRASIPWAFGILRLLATGGSSGYLLIAGGVVLFQVSAFNEAALDRAIHAVTRTIAKVISTVAAWLIFAFVLVGWLVHAVTRVDVLHRARAADKGWARLPAPGSEDRSFLHEEPSHRGRWRIRLLAFLLTVAVVSYASWTIISRPSSRAITYHAFAFRNEPWGHDAIRDFHRTHLERDGALGWRNADFTGRYINIDDTVRRSWTPAHPVLTVWVFGGSAAFGVGQRDEHTIPSDLARLAAADGIRIRVVNFATPAYVAWQEALQLRTELARRPDPDLVIVYHGANDLADIDRLVAAMARLRQHAHAL